MHSLTKFNSLYSISNFALNTPSGSILIRHFSEKRADPGPSSTEYVTSHLKSWLDVRKAPLGR